MTVESRATIPINELGYSVGWRMDYIERERLWLWTVAASRGDGHVFWVRSADLREVRGVGNPLDAIFYGAGLLSGLLGHFGHRGKWPSQAISL